jgi:hypothetical protein
MKTNNLVSIVSLSLIMISLVLSCSTDTDQPTPQKPPIKVEVYIKGNYLNYTLTRTSGSEVKKYAPGDKIPIKQGDKINTFIGLDNKAEGTISYYEITDSTRVLLSTLTRVGQFELEFKY